MGLIQHLRARWQAKKQARYQANAVRFERVFSVPVKELAQGDLKLGRKARIAVINQLNQLADQAWEASMRAEQTAFTAEEKQKKPLLAKQAAEAERCYDRAWWAAKPFANDLRLGKIPEQTTLAGYGHIPLK